MLAFHQQPGFESSIFTVSNFPVLSGAHKLGMFRAPTRRKQPDWYLL